MKMLGRLKRTVRNTRLAQAIRRGSVITLAELSRRLKEIEKTYDYDERVVGEQQVKGRIYGRYS